MCKTLSLLAFLRTRGHLDLFSPLVCNNYTVSTYFLYAGIITDQKLYSNKFCSEQVVHKSGNSCADFVGVLVMLDSMHCEKTCQNLVPKNSGEKNPSCFPVCVKKNRGLVGFSPYVLEADCVGLIAAKHYHL